MALEEIKLEDGSVRRLGNMVPTKAMSGDWPLFGSAEKAKRIPRSEWDALLDQYPPGLEDPRLPPVTDQNGVGQCFPRGTLVRMADGSQRPIESVRVTEEVLTAEGRTKPVLRTMARKAKGIVRVQAWGLRHLRCTDEHPFLTKRGYVPAGELKADDYLAIPKYSPVTSSVLMTADHIGVGRVHTRRAVNSTRSFGIPGKASAVVTRIRVPDAIELSADFGWLVGMYLAEGCTGHGKIDFCLHLNETDTHAARLIDIMSREFGVAAVIRKVGGESKKAIKVTAYGVEWAKLMESLCAAGSGSKRLHPDLCSAPKEFLEGVLAGWTDGDGIGPKHNGGVSVSHELAVGMFDIANSLGLRPTIETLDVKTYGAVKSRKRRYIVKWGKHVERADWHCDQDETHLWRKVDKVTPEEFEGWVYNLEVEGDNSYVAESVGVHNCNANATISCIEYVRGLQSLPYVQLSPADLYARINWGRDGGSLLEDGIRAAMEEGVGTAATSGLLWKNGSYKGPASKEERKKYRVLEAFLCPTFDDCFSAVLQGFALVSGVMWYDNYEPDSEGWLPVGRGNAGGHAIFGYRPVRRTKNGRTEYGIAHQNSWSERWGKKGLFVIPESAYSGPVGGWWCARSTTDEGGIVPMEATAQVENEATELVAA